LDGLEQRLQVALARLYVDRLEHLRPLDQARHVACHVAAFLGNLQRRAQTAESIGLGVGRTLAAVQRPLPLIEVFGGQVAQLDLAEERLDVAADENPAGRPRGRLPTADAFAAVVFGLIVFQPAVELVTEQPSVGRGPHTLLA
jgi:hypothetical protein